MASYSPYSNVSNAYRQMTRGGSRPSLAGDTISIQTPGSASSGGSSGSPINYSQPTDALRPYRDVTNISGMPTDPRARLDTLTRNKYQELASSLEASKLLAQDQFRSSMGVLGKLGASDQDAIFGGWRQAGLLSETPTQWGTSEYRARSLQSPGQRANTQLMGLVNRANLGNIGINPNSIQSAYDRIMRGR